MKRIVLFIMSIVLSVGLYAQKDVTTFLGIPVDGSKSKMIRKLKTKGFRVVPYSVGELSGEFNGADVSIYCSTNRNKVYQIAVVEQIKRDAKGAKARYNELLKQFQNNEKYVCRSLTLECDSLISDEEDLDYNIQFNKKVYSTIFCQLPAGLTADALKNTINNAWNTFQIQHMNESPEEITEELKSYIEEIFQRFFYKEVFLGILGEKRGI